MMKRTILAAIGLCFVAACNPEAQPAAPAEVETPPLTEPPVVQVGEVCGGITDAACEGEGDTTYCKKNPGAEAGVCTVKYTGECTWIYMPVCSVDGNTYSNTCFAEVAGVNIAHQGPCEQGAALLGSAETFGREVRAGETCGGKDRPQECPGETEACILPIGQCNSPDSEGMCIDTTAACIGPQVVVCGCDGKTYGSPCAAYQAGAGVAHYNECAVDE